MPSTGKRDPSPSPPDILLKVIYKMWFSMLIRSISAVLIDLTCLWDPLETLFSAFPQITSWSMEVTWVLPLLREEADTSFCLRLLGAEAKMWKSWSSTGIWMAFVEKATTLSFPTSEKLGASPNSLFVHFSHFESLSCGMFSSSVLLIQRFVKCAPSLREFMVEKLGRWAWN